MLIGRKEEVLLLENAYKEALKNGGLYQFISGEAGLGKTYLMENFLQQKKEDSIVTVYVQCTSQIKGEEMYRPCIEIISQLSPLIAEKTEPESKFIAFFKSDSSKVLNIASEIMGFVPGLNAVGAAIRIGLSLKEGKKPDEIDNQLEKYNEDKVSFYSDVIIGLSMVRPFILVIDDIHWADLGTISVLRQMFSTNLQMLKAGRKPQLLLICCTRELESKTDEVGKEVVKIKEFFSRYDNYKGLTLFHEHRLSSMSNENMLRLLDYELDEVSILTKPFKQWVLDKAAGNPLKLINTIKILKQYGVLTYENDQWKDAAEISRTPDEKWQFKGKMLQVQKQGALVSLEALALEPLRNITEQDQRLLYFAASVGQHFTSDIIAFLAEKNEPTILWDLKRLENLGFIQKSGELSRGLKETYLFKFNSQILREALYSVLFPIQSATIEIRIAEFFDNTIKQLEKQKEDIHVLIENSVGKIKTELNRKLKLIDRELLNLYSEAVLYYHKGKDYSQALYYVTELLEANILILKDLEIEDIAFSEIENIDKNIHLLMKKSSDLMEKSYESLGLLPVNDYTVLNYHIIHNHIARANFFKHHKEYNFAVENLKQADDIVYQGNIDNAKTDIYSEWIELFYESGDYKNARRKVNDFIEMLGLQSFQLDQELNDAEVYSICSTIAEKESPPIGIYYISLLLDFIKHWEPANYVSIKVFLLELYLKNSDKDGAGNVLKELLKYEDANSYVQLHDAIERLVGEMGLFIIVGDDLTYGGRTTSFDDWDPYYLNWLITAHDWISGVLCDIFYDPEKYRIAEKDAVKVFDSLTVLATNQIDISIDIEPDPNDYEDENEYEIACHTNMKLKPFRENINTIFEKYFNSEEWGSKVITGLRRVRLTLGEDEWAEQASYCLGQFGDFFSLYEAKELFNELDNYLSTPNDRSITVVDLYSSWLIYLATNIDKKGYLKIYEEVTNKVIGELFPKYKEENPIIAIRLLWMVIDNYQSYFEHEDSPAWAILIDGIEFCKSIGDIESARSLYSEFAELFAPSKSKLKELRENVFDSNSRDDDNKYTLGDDLLFEYSDIGFSKSVLFESERRLDEDILKLTIDAIARLQKIELDKRPELLGQLYFAVSRFFFEADKLPSKKIIKELIKITTPKNVGELAILNRYFIEYAQQAICIQENIMNWREIIVIYENLLLLADCIDFQLENEEITKEEYEWMDLEQIRKDYVSFLIGKGQIEEAIHMVIGLFERMEGYEIGEECDIFPVLEIMVMEGIVQHLKDENIDNLLECYKSRIGSMIYKSEWSQKLLSKLC